MMSTPGVSLMAEPDRAEDAAPTAWPDMPSRHCLSITFESKDKRRIESIP